MAEEVWHRGLRRDRESSQTEAAMKRALLVAVAGLAGVHGAIQPAAGADFLDQRGTGLILDGKPFYEISFNKFDLYRQILAAELGRGGFGSEPVAAAENALRSLQSFGFRTIRIFLSDPSGVKAFVDPAQRPGVLAAMDRTLALCDKYDIGFAAWKEAAARIGKPLYVGEWGALAQAKNEKTARFWAGNPELVALVAAANRRLQMATMGFTYAKIPAHQP
jgi:hypothetical protein